MSLKDKAIPLEQPVSRLGSSPTSCQLMKPNQATIPKMSPTGQERNIAYLITFVFVASHLAPLVPVKCTGHTVVPFANMNKTIRDQMRKQKFLNNVRDRLLKSSARNSSTSAGPIKGSFSPRSQESHQFSHTQPQQFNNTVWSPPNLIYSDSIEKNALTFRFKSNTVRNNTQVNRINLWLYVWTKEAKDKGPAATASPKTRDLQTVDRLERRQGKRIKIRVFLSDANGFRGQRIAELKTRIEASTWGKLGLPVSLINSLLDTDTLRLRVECKLCTRKTQLVLPGNTDSKRCIKRQTMRKKKKKKTKETKMRRWRKHCSKMENLNKKLFPFIVIEEKIRSINGRRKRESADKGHADKGHADKGHADKGHADKGHADKGHADKGHADKGHADKDHADKGYADTDETVCHNLTRSGHEDLTKKSYLPTGNVRHCCTPVKISVDFADLGLDHLIVYPSGFEFVSCIDGCSQTSISFLDQVKAHLDRVIRLVSKKILNHHVKSWRSHPFTSTYTVRRHNKWHRQQSQHDHHRHVRRDHWHKHRRSRLKTYGGKCQPAETRDLLILHFTREHKLAPLELPSFIVTRCQCKDDLSSAKDSTSLGHPPYQL